jgi:hypothetical protein
VVSVHDPEMRHGRKSASKRFDGHKAAVAVDTDEPLITAVTVLAGNAPDHEQARELVEQSAAATGCTVDEAHGDCAYGDGPTRQAFAEAGLTLVAKVPGDADTGYFSKTDFTLDPAAHTCVCPAGHPARRRVVERNGGVLYRFDPAVCGICPLRAQCVKGRGGRSVQQHPQEALIQAARARQQSPQGRLDRARRQVVEHRLARLVQLGIRQARYVGRAKTLFQLLLAAAVANLTLLANDDLAAAVTTAAPEIAVTVPGLLLGLLVVCWMARAADWQPGPTNPVPATARRLIPTATMDSAFPVGPLVRNPASRPRF